MRLKDLQRKYMLFDADGTGMIDALELGDVLRAVGLNPIESRVLVRLLFFPLFGVTRVPKVSTTNQLSNNHSSPPPGGVFVARVFCRIRRYQVLSTRARTSPEWERAQRVGRPLPPPQPGTRLHLSQALGVQGWGQMRQSGKKNK